MSEFFATMGISAYGMKAQGERLRVISQNLANSETAPSTPGGDPYTRKSVVFKNELNKRLGFDTVKVDQVRKDTSEPYPMKYMPDHPGANEDGYVKMPNVNTLVEMNDMREAQRAYEANLGMIDQSRNMMLQTIDLLRR